jgi:hypothetical protein
MLESSELTDFEYRLDPSDHKLRRHLGVGQSALQLLASLGIMLYLTFFLLRNGERLSAQVKVGDPPQPGVARPTDRSLHHGDPGDDERHCRGVGYAGPRRRNRRSDHRCAVHDGLDHCR